MNWSGEVHHEARMCGQPTLYRRRFVGGGIVENQVHIEIGGHFGVDLAEERQELGGPVTDMQRTDDLAVAISRAA